MEFSYNKLLGKMCEENETQETLAKKIKISKHSLNRKLKGKSYFRQQEICMICKLLNLEFKNIPLYFFNEKVQKTEQKKEE